MRLVSCIVVFILLLTLSTNTLALEDITIDEMMEDLTSYRTLDANDWHYQNVTPTNRHLYSVEFRGWGPTGTIPSLTCEVWGATSNDGEPANKLGELTLTDVDRNAWISFDFDHPIDLDGYTSSDGTGRLVIALTTDSNTMNTGLKTPASAYSGGKSRYSANQGTSFTEINSDFCFRVSTYPHLNLPYSHCLDANHQDLSSYRTLTSNDWHYQNVTPANRYLYTVEFRGYGPAGNIPSVTCEVWGTSSNDGEPVTKLGEATLSNADKQKWLRFDFKNPIDLNGYTSSSGTGRTIIALTTDSNSMEIGLETPGSVYSGGSSRYSADQGSSFTPINSDFCFRIRTDSDAFPGINMADNGSTDPKDNMFMADRTINFINEIAASIASTHPNNLVETYAYGDSRWPPLNQKVDPNILVIYANVNGPMGQGLMYDDIYTNHQQIREHLRGWVNSGATNIAFYGYDDWEHPDISLCWLYGIADMLYNINNEYGVTGTTGEHASNTQSSPAYWQVMSEVLWDAGSYTDYNDIVNTFCDNYFGDANGYMRSYYDYMDSCYKNCTTWDPCDHPNWHVELTMANLRTAEDYLDDANDAVFGTSPYEERVNHVRFGHAYLIYVKDPNSANKSAANALRTNYSIYVRKATDTALD